MRSMTAEGAAGLGRDGGRMSELNQTPHPSGSAAHLLPQGEKE